MVASSSRQQAARGFSHGDRNTLKGGERLLARSRAHSTANTPIMNSDGVPCHCNRWISQRTSRCSRVVGVVAALTPAFTAHSRYSSRRRVRWGDAEYAHRSEARTSAAPRVPSKRRVAETLAGSTGTRCATITPDFMLTFDLAAKAASTSITARARPRLLRDETTPDRLAYVEIIGQFDLDDAPILRGSQWPARYGLAPVAFDRGRARRPGFVGARVL